MFGLPVAFSLAGILRFLTSPLGKLVLGVLFVSTVYLAGDARGRRIEYAKSQALAERARQDAIAQDRKALKASEQNAEETISALKTQKENSDAQLDNLRKQLQERPANAPCLYGPNGQPAGVVPNNGYASPRPRRPRHTRPTRLPTVLTQPPSH